MFLRNMILYPSHTGYGRYCTNCNWLVAFHSYSSLPSPSCYSGRKGITTNLKLDTVGVEVDDSTGQIQVDSTDATTVPHIFAIGDVVSVRRHKSRANVDYDDIIVYYIDN